jgi:hypothetical protein
MSIRVPAWFGRWLLGNAVHRYFCGGWWLICYDKTGGQNGQTYT